MTTPRKLSEVFHRHNFENQISAESLEGVVFVLQSGAVVETRFGPRCSFTLTTEDGVEHTLLLAYDGYRQQIVDALRDGPIGPVTLVRRPGKYNNPYWLLTDAE